MTLDEFYILLLEDKEHLSPVTKEEIETATKELTDLIQKFCGGEVSYEILYEKHIQAEL